MSRFTFYLPVKPFVINQPWGVFRPEVYSRFGFASHNGIDIALGKDKTVYAPFAGTIIRTGNQPSGGGVFLGLLSDIPYDFDDGKNAFVLMDPLHLERLLVKEGDHVSVGQKLAIADNTGFSTGPHTHFQLRRERQIPAPAHAPNSYRLLNQFVWLEDLDQNDANNSFDPMSYAVSKHALDMFPQPQLPDSRIPLLEMALSLAQKLLGLVQKQPTIEDLARAIEWRENANKDWNNPGALRSSPFQDGEIIQQSTGSPMATFLTYQKGWNALLHQLRIVITGKSPVYNAKAKQWGLPDSSELTLLQFVSIYAPKNENHSLKYAQDIAARLKVTPDFKMKQFRI